MTASIRVLAAALLAVSMALPFGAPVRASTSPEAAPPVTSEAILHDPDAPEAGNPKGDLTIVAFFDYNCPFCKKAEPVLDRLLKSDPGIRLVYKDWPILAQSSVYGAQLALAAKYQGRYVQAHGALMALSGRSSDKEMRAALKAAGVDMARLEKDLRKHARSIVALMKRNHAQAEALGLDGTPVFLVGPLLIPAALDDAGFRQAVADARAAQERSASSLTSPQQKTDQ